MKNFFIVSLFLTTIVSFVFAIEKPFQLPDLIVTVEREKSLPKKEKISAEKLSDSSVGLFNGISETLRLMPGIVSSDFSGLLYIRGSEPIESIYVLDRAFIEFPYRWGGRLDIFNTRLIDQIDLYTGYLPAEVGNVLGGAIDIKYRNPRKDRWRGIVEVSPTTLDILLEGSLNKSKNVSALFSAKRTYYDFIAKLFDAGNVYPYFHELYGKVKWDLNASNSFSFFNLYNNEGMDFKDTETDREKLGRIPFSFKYFYDKNVTSFNWNSILGSFWTHDFTLTQTLDRGNFDFKDDDTIWTMKIQNLHYYLRQDLTYNFKDSLKFKTGSFLAFGKFLAQNRSEKTYTDAQLQKQTDVNVIDFKLNRLYYLGAYFSQEWRIFDPLLLEAGLRYDHLFLSEKDSLTPRAAINYDVLEGLTLNASAGVYSQFSIDPAIYDNVSGNPKIDPQYVETFTSGFVYKMGKNYRLKADVYRKNFSDLIVKNSVSNYNNSGRGQAKGFEVFLEKQSQEKTKLDGWLTYSKVKSERSVGDEAPRDFLGSQNLFQSDYYAIDPNRLYTAASEREDNVSFVVNWKFLPTWKLSLDWLYRSGAPYTPVTGSQKGVDAAGKTIYRPVLADFNSGRLPDYHRLDVKLTRERVMRWGIMRSYVQILNAYNKSNIYGYYYNDDYSRRYEQKVLGFLFLGGVEIEW